MPPLLQVLLADRPIGTMTNLAGDYNLFAFDASYLDDPSPPVLSQSFIAHSGSTVRQIPRTHRVAPPFFANLLPEEDTLLRGLLARHSGVSRNRDFPLLASLGPDLPGAIVIRDVGVSGEPVTPETDVREEAFEERPLRFSLAGVQLKFSAGMVGRRLTIPVDGVGGSWIVKLPTNAWARLPENEFAMMSLAARIGLAVPSVELRELDLVEGLPHDMPALRTEEPRIVYAVRRFDRGPSGARVHAEDFNQIAGQPPADKYENKTMHWIANVVATLCPDEDRDELVRRIVFGVCIGNDDMHLKNWALIYPDGRYARLSPLYDYVCTRRYLPAGTLALTIAGERRFERIDKEVLRAFARRAEISVKRTLAVADDVVAKLRATWPSFKDEVPDEALVAALERHFAAVPLMNGR